MKTFGFAIATLVSVALLAGCAGRPAAPLVPSLVPQRAALQRERPDVNASFTLKIFVSSSVAARSVTLVLTQIGGSAKGTFYANLVRGANSVKISLPANRYNLTITSFAGPLKNGKPSGARTSNNAGVPVGLSNGGSLGVALGGTLASAIFVPRVPLVYNVAAKAYEVSKCFTPFSVSVFGRDANGRYLLGPNPPTPGLVSGNAHVVVGTPPPSTPNVFTLTRSKIPNASTTATLTASVTLGASKKSTAPKLLFGPQICGVVTEYTIPTAESDPAAVVAGPDGNMWFIETNTAKIGKITMAGKITEYSTSYDPADITVGPDKNLWFTESNSPTYSLDYYGKMTTSGAKTEYASTTGNFTGIEGIAPGSDGQIWFLQCASNVVSKATTSGMNQTDYSTGLTASSNLRSATLGNDGDVWFTQGVGQVGKIATNGTITEYSQGFSGGASPLGIAQGPDDNMWVTESGLPGIAKVTPSGTVTEYTSGITPDSFPYGITVGADGALWFSENHTKKFGRITTSGAITEISPTGITGPYPAINGIALGPDGALWFAECGGGKIGRLQ